MKISRFQVVLFLVLVISSIFQFVTAADYNHLDNCVNWVREYRVSSLPYDLYTIEDKMSMINSDEAQAGSVAVIRTSFPEGHLAYVKSVIGDQITIEEANYLRAGYFVRTDTKENLNIVGFYKPNKLSDYKAGIDYYDEDNLTDPINTRLANILFIKDFLPLEKEKLAHSVYISLSFLKAYSNYHHKGIDFAIRTGVEVYSPVSGVVLEEAISSKTGENINEKYGQIFVYDSTHDCTFNFQHLSYKAVSPGDTVKIGQLIGKTGSVGAPGGAHLHVGLRAGKMLHDGDTNLDDTTNYDPRIVLYWIPIESVKPPVDNTPKVATPSTQKININGKTISVDMFNIGGLNYIQLKTYGSLLVEYLGKGFHTLWNAVSDTIDLIWVNNKVYAAEEYYGSISKQPQRAIPTTSSLVLEGKNLNITGYNIKGYNYYPVRELGNALGYSIGYDSDNRQVTIALPNANINTSNTQQSVRNIEKPSLQAPSSGSSFRNSPQLYWREVSSPSNSRVEYFAETYDCPNPENSGWISSTSWKPSSVVKGSYNWRVKSRDSTTGKESGWGDTWRYLITSETTQIREPGIPRLTAPSSGYSMKVNETVQLQWSDTGASKYRIEVMNDSGTGTFGEDVYGTSYNFTPRYSGNWRWQVRSYLGSGSRTDPQTANNITVNQGTTLSIPTTPIVVTPSNPSIPTLGSTSNGTTMNVGQTITLNWSNTGATKYKIEIINDSGTGTFGEVVYGTSYSFTPMYSGNWRWQVRSYNSNGVVGDASPTKSFTVLEVVVLPPDHPNPISPASRTTYRNGTPTLTWSAVSGSSYSNIEYFAHTYDCPNPQESGWISGTSWTPNSNALGTYNWNVKARDKVTGKESGWGATYQFILEATPDSQNRNLEIKSAVFGPYDSHGTNSDMTWKVRENISNNSVTINATDSFFFPAGDPGPSYSKRLTVNYTNRWNEEYQVTRNEGESITINWDSREGSYVRDHDQ